jgi:hypothetical protein
LGIQIRIIDLEFYEHASQACSLERLPDSTYIPFMPTISSFYGILIRMFFNDHAPPHFHVQYAKYKATVDIESLKAAA